MALLLAQAGLVPNALGWIGLLPAAAILVGLEPLGVAWAGLINAIGYLASSVWLLIVGVVFLVP